MNGFGSQIADLHAILDPDATWDEKSHSLSFVNQSNISPTTTYGQPGHALTYFGSTILSPFSFSPLVLASYQPIIQPPFRTYSPSPNHVLLDHKKRPFALPPNMHKFVAKHGCIHEKWLIQHT